MGFYLLDGFCVPARSTLALEKGRVQKANSSNTFVTLYMRLVRKDEQEKMILEIPRRENPRIPLDMGRDTNAGRAGRGGHSGRGGRGQGGCGRGASVTVPRKASEVGA